ncbi:hypothetical protein DCAR_0727072 [Daucus carota subsp. sativus]|uniref:Mannose-6-phosphate isomerase n=1 Tax=Daucus carota subsp. sativus TaxID=79200 RepID=A0A164SQ99_DAUCS|nr:PREDICTED: mannose-6-phosphate isomerase 1-like [Daucus carota subsp. sativus]XP_017218816.1 PREDICTED: mannose-6-phosphate isomerase 1-like [Daucus carota subsp. sativus]XP_017218817.1 PREDICTED: mannose-6-phosphate isomerase 1-like [Daucus carota subsp. sativus]WOH07639.1 hypothetical protein DCAR_0727072 [Daucus carota subsp. sativus]
MASSTNGSANSHSRTRLQRLRCSVQNYDWGRVGYESAVARLYCKNSGVEIDENKCYAELWMGTHASGPSFVVGENGEESLKSWIENNPGVLGDKVFDKWNTNLPFLFKVLSIAKALSIQAHPDKKLAELLHRTQPDMYKDDNHKPEMVLAITDFEALCGFTDLEELQDILRDFREVSEVVGTAYTDQVLNCTEKDEVNKKASLQALFTKLMSTSKEVISGVLAKLINRLNLESKARELTSKEALVLRLQKQYPDDIGIIAALLFNYIKLKPGEALYLGANEPHAYIFGECIECMATSDNVVRAGLTPKKRDTEILCSMLTYKQGSPEILPGVNINSSIKRYTPPLDEFEIDHCVLKDENSVVFPAVPSPSIFLVTAGNGTMKSEAEEIVSEGDVLFAPANTRISVTAASELHLYRAGVNSRFFGLD